MESPPAIYQFVQYFFYLQIVSSVFFHTVKIIE